MLSYIVYKVLVVSLSVIQYLKPWSDLPKTAKLTTYLICNFFILIEKNWVVLLSTFS
jgi:hypothetical protein